MSDLLTVLPDFDASAFTHILPSLEKALISAADLLTLDALDVAKRAQVPQGEVKKLADTLLDVLHQSFTKYSVESRDCDKGPIHDTVKTITDEWAPISTLDDSLDYCLKGGIATGHLTEIVGESAAGKTQFLLTLLLSVQLSSRAVGNSMKRPVSAIYISTEAPLQTTRLEQIFNTHPKLAALTEIERPSLSRIYSTHVHDVEAQDHILRFQVPVAIQKHNVRLLVIDSIAANYRAEYDKGGESKAGTGIVAKRASQIVKTGSLLRNLADTYNVAVVVANQVADRFNMVDTILPLPSQSTQTPGPGTPVQLVSSSTVPSYQTSLSELSTDDPLSLDYQQRFFTGWGDDLSGSNLKSPSLGLAWTNQLSSRIALLKQPIYETKVYNPGDERNLIGWKRAFKVVFSAWCAESTTSFEIWEGGVRSADTVTDDRQHS